MIQRGRGKDPRLVAERRRRGLKVREAREKLTTSDTGHRGCDVGLLRAYASTRIHSAVPATALIALVAALTR
jgi:two-component system cell cycle sensor histidine kinase PleC